MASSQEEFLYQAVHFCLFYSARFPGSGQPGHHSDNWVGPATRYFYADAAGEHRSSLLA